MAVYLTSMAPGLTWAHYGADGGDLITAAATRGVAHPSGYPLYLLLARLFQYLPVGSLAFRTNLMSACATALAAVLVYNLVTGYLSSLPQRYLAGVVSAFAFGLAPLVWSQAVISEVYALHGLFAVLILYFSSDFHSLSLTPDRRDILLGLTFGLSLSNHLTTLLLLPGLFSSTFLRQDGHLRPDWHAILRRLAWLGVGLLPYLSLPLRALAHPPINWGNPVTLDGFTWLITGRLYQGQLFVLTAATLWERVQTVAAVLLQQFGVPGLLAGFAGLIIFFTPSNLYRNMLWSAIAFSIFAIGYVTQDSSVYLIPVFLSFAIWIGIGLGRLADVFSRRYSWFGWVVNLTFVAALIIQAGIHWPQVDVSKDLRAEDFGKEVLAQAPAHAVVFAKGDRAVFTLWYFHFALHERSDLAAIATDLLHFPWYQETLRATYPDLNIPGPYPFPETIAYANADRPVCYVEYQGFTQIECFPPQQP